MVKEWGWVPLYGVIGKAEIMDLPDVGNMSSTHSANPLVCSAGLAVLNELREKNLVEESEKKGYVLKDLLNNLKMSFQITLHMYLAEDL